MKSNKNEQSKVKSSPTSKDNGRFNGIPRGLVVTLPVRPAADESIFDFDESTGLDVPNFVSDKLDLAVFLESDDLLVVVDLPLFDGVKAYD